MEIQNVVEQRCKEKTMEGRKVTMDCTDEFEHRFLFSIYLVDPVNPVHFLPVSVPSVVNELHRTFIKRRGGQDGAVRCRKRHRWGGACRG